MLSASEPGRYDDWLPEVAVDAGGSVYALWYDYSGAPDVADGGWSRSSLARSDDGGSTWLALGAASTALTDWTNTFSNIIPNMGDYQSLFADAQRVYPCWTDGSHGTSDIRTAPFAIDATTPAVASCIEARAADGCVVLAWQVAAGGDARLERRAADGPWRAIATLAIGGDGRVAFDDRDVTPGATYAYRLGVWTGDGWAAVSEVTVAMPGAPLAIEGARPNPARAPVAVAFTLAAGGAYTLELLDTGGRVVARHADVATAGRHVVTLDGHPAPGVYFARLAQGGRAAVTRVAVVGGR
jgi:hypothetical protein